MLLATPVHPASIPCPHRKDHGGQSYQSLCVLSDALGYWLTNPSGLPWPQPPLRLDCSISCQFHALGRTTHPAPSCLSGHPPALARPAPRPVHRREAPALRDESLTENALEEWIEPSARMDLVASDPRWPPQNRPFMATSKPAISNDARTEFFTSILADEASTFSQLEYNANGLSGG